MDQIIFAGSIQFALLGVGLAILMLLAGNIGVLMALPLLMTTGLLPEQAVPIALLITAALIVPGALEHLRAGNVDKKFIALILLGALPGAFLSKYLCNTVLQQNQVVLFSLYGLLLGANFIYRRRPFPIFPKPNNPVRRKIASFLKDIPGTIHFSGSDLNLCPLIPMFLGFIQTLMATTLGPVAAMLLCPIMVILLEVPIFVAIGTAAVVNVFSFVSVAVVSGMLEYPPVLQILLWMFLGTAITYTLVSSLIRDRKLRTLPLAIILLTVTSLNLL